MIGRIPLRPTTFYNLLCRSDIGRIQESPSFNPLSFHLKAESVRPPACLAETLGRTIPSEIPLPPFFLAHAPEIPHLQS